MQNKSLIIVLLILVTSITVLAETYIWYVPHPDDEIIGMGGAIRNSILQGNDNKVVILTQGKASNVRKILALSKEDFGASRTLESVEALKILGINEEDIFVCDFPDGKLSFENIRTIVQDFSAKYPHSIHNTVSVFDLHKDHQKLAKTLYREYLNKNISAVNFYRVYSYRTHGQNYKTLAVEAIEIADVQNKIKALEAFSRWDPTKGFYSIGKLSVSDLISKAAKIPYEFKDNIEVIPEIAYTNNVNITTSQLKIYYGLITALAFVSKILL